MHHTKARVSCRFNSALLLLAFLCLALFPTFQPAKAQGLPLAYFEARVATSESDDFNNNLFTNNNFTFDSSSASWSTSGTNYVSFGAKVNGDSVSANFNGLVSHSGQLGACFSKARVSFGQLSGYIDVYVLGQPGTPFEVTYSGTSTVNASVTTDVYACTPNSVGASALGITCIAANTGDSCQKERPLYDGIQALKGITSSSTRVYKNETYSYATTFGVGDVRALLIANGGEDFTAQAGSKATLNISVNSNSCGDERDQIIQEYKDYKVCAVCNHSSPDDPNEIRFVPTCNDFTQSARSTYFSFNELKTDSDYSRAILRPSLLAGLDSIRAGYGGPLSLSSGYRNPANQYRLDTSNNRSYTRGSRHQFGDAADILTPSGPLLFRIDQFFIIQRLAKGNGACTEPRALSGVGHVHADWRSGCPNGW